jgi:two-component system cell cycle response regulator
MSSDGRGLRVLVVDDEDQSRAALEIAVRELGHACAVAADGAQALEMHHQTPFEVIVSDWTMPRMSGIELCKAVRHGHDYVHFILATSYDDKAHFRQGIEAGADDYLSKPIDIDELQARLLSAGRVIHMQRALRRQNRILRHDSQRFLQAAQIDPVTCVKSRYAMERDLEALATNVTRYDYRYAGALCDIDFFKHYNDTYGHLKGDEALRNVASAIRDGLRQGDELYRYGGEEFLVVLPAQSAASAAAAMERVRRAVEGLGLTISVGVAVFSGGEVSSWLKRADDALYAAKANGRNCVLIEPPPP